MQLVIHLAADADAEERMTTHVFIPDE